ncbi:chromate efflux transporter [Parahaliea maris]|uniref:Chromate efflux transporter n=1 Tax=Parahaliea maris TaxID=2716870 RepID=A0A5C8ZVX1_9GAMM|nr:chromate efflux transporter [Parahaliea maris]
MFWRFLVLGCVSFGGPAAHMGYFHREFVERRQWLSEQHFASLLALCQFLPGPGSSQLGFAIGLHRAGLAGAVLAFLGFSLPSLLLMFLLALYGGSLSAGPLAGLVHGLKLLAVVVVADAVWQMSRSHCRQRTAGAIALLAAALLLALEGPWVQYLVLLGGAGLGSLALRAAPSAETPSLATITVASSRLHALPLLLFAALFLLLPLLEGAYPGLALFNAFFQAGSLVFGGGHVVLPLLQHGLAGSLPQDSFLLGYAAAQAVPGPMFSLSAYLGAELSPGAPALGAVVAVAGIFLPGFLLLLGFHSHWTQLASRVRVAAAIRGVNAAVVGLLLAALYQPVFVSAVSSAQDVALLLLGFLLLRVLHLPVPWLVAAFAVAGLLQVAVR